MSLRIRLRQHGKKNCRVYRIVVSDVRSPREGKYVDCLGWYDPFSKEEENFSLDGAKTMYWVKLGALPTDGVLPFIRKSAKDVVSLIEQRKMVRRASRKEERRRAAVRRLQRSEKN